MSFIPIVKSPYPDELLYSWVHRLADENLLSEPAFSRAFFYPEKPYSREARMGSLPVDIRDEFPSLWRNLYIKSGMKETYLMLTTFQFEAMTMTPLYQARYINSVFRPKSGLNSPINALYNTLRVCRECIEEDMAEYGRPYIHRAHQLSGVCTCHKHGTALLEYCGKSGHECEFDINDYREIRNDVSINSLKVYTEYAQTLFESKVNTNIYKIKETLFEQIEKRGYGTADNYSGFLKDFEKWKHAALLADIDFLHFFKGKMISCRNVSLEELLPVLMFLFPDASALIGQISTESPILEQYSCPDCGTEYCSSPVAVENGWGCPSCNESLTEQEIFRRVVEKTGRGNYEPTEDFQSMDTPVRIRHKTCGLTSAIKPRAFLYEGVRCLCESTVTEQEARNAVEAYPEFKLIQFNGTNDPVIIRHEKCGREFSCNYHKFLNFPGCRACKPPHMTAEIYEERVKNLVGDEYSIIKGFTSQKEKVILKHNICGCDQAYKPSAFLDGQRCRKCRSLLPHYELERMLDGYSSGQYEITEYGTNVCTIQDNTTGKAIQMSPLKVAQEITRKTPSPLLPLKNEHQTVSRPLSAWEQAYQELLKYRDEFGNANVPKRMKYDGFSLGIWCEHQRAAKGKGTLKKDYEDRLTEIGFAWNPLEEEWLRRYEQYKRYIYQTGSPYIPRRTDFEGEHLGAWVETQRKRHQKGALSNAREDMLLLLNPDLFLSD